MKKMITLGIFWVILSQISFSQNSTCISPSGAMQQPDSTNPTCFPGHTGPNSGSLTQYYTFIATQTTMMVNLTPILGTSCSFPNTGINYSNLELYAQGNCTTPIATGAYFTNLIPGNLYIWGVTMTPQDTNCVWIAQACPRVVEMPVPLPLNLELFQVHSDENQVKIHWELAPKESFQTFEIQKLDNRGNFSPIGSIPGNTSANLNPEWEFLTSPIGSEFTGIRIAAIRHDGNIHYSEIQRLQPDEKNTPSLRIGPNPVTDQTRIHYSGNPETPAMIRMMNLQGKILWEASGKIPDLSNELVIELKARNPGIYSIGINLDGNVRTLRLIKR